jgi:aldose sugar dehydrogenase
MLLCTLTLFPSLVSYNNLAYSAYESEVSSSDNSLGEDDNSNSNTSNSNTSNDTPYGGERGSSQPVINDPNLRLELVSKGLQLPTQMAFIGPNDILVLEKDTGIVKRIVNGTILEEPLLDVNVATAYERGLLGIAITKNDNETTQRNASTVYLYYTESEQDANDVCSDTGSCSEANGPLGNRLYRYELVDNKLVNQNLLVDLPASSGAVHNGGSISIGPDNNIYLPIGEVGYQAGQISNNDDGPPPDGRGGILRVTQQGEAVGTRVNGGDEDDENNSLVGIIGDKDPLNKYYAYGIRNSFGLAIDPVNGTLWDTENGDKDYDEINVVEPGFNSGWEQLMGPISESDIDTTDLVSIPGSDYSDPALSFAPSLGLTDIEFLSSSMLGDRYMNNIFVGDINNGNLYFFELNGTRNGLKFDPTTQSGLGDRVADGDDELDEIVLGTGFRGITDIETGPDGFLYILTFDQESGGDGKIYRISSNDNSGFLN